MRKTITTAVLALATLAIAAPAASAQTPAEPPHSSASADWRAVEVWDYNGGLPASLRCGAETDCDYSAAGAHMTGFVKQWGVVQRIDDDEYTASGEVSFDGTVTTDSWVFGGNDAMICQHRLTGELGIRQTVNESGAVFGQVLGEHYAAPSDWERSTFLMRGIVYGNPDANSFASGSYTTQGSSVEFYISVELNDIWEKNDLVVGPKSNDADCSWPELS